MADLFSVTFAYCGAVATRGPEFAPPPPEQPPEPDDPEPLPPPPPNKWSVSTVSTMRSLEDEDEDEDEATATEAAATTGVLPEAAAMLSSAIRRSKSWSEWKEEKIILKIIRKPNESSCEKNDA